MDIRRLRKVVISLAYQFLGHPLHLRQHFLDQDFWKFHTFSHVRNTTVIGLIVFLQQSNTLNYSSHLGVDEQLCKVILKLRSIQNNLTSEQHFIQFGTAVFKCTAIIHTYKQTGYDNKYRNK